MEFEDVDIEDLDDLLCVLKNTRQYGRMRRYSFDQDFLWGEFLKNITADGWLLKSPLTEAGAKNKKRILTTWQKFPLVANTIEARRLLKKFMPLPSVLVQLVAEYYGKFSSGVLFIEKK